MKVVIYLLLLVLMLTTGCGTVGNSEFTVRVSGDPGLRFNGTYMSVTSGGNSTSKTVDGSVPVEYTVNGNIVSVVFQKQAELGYMKVEILKGGDVVSESETTAAYGVVSVATQ